MGAVGVGKHCDCGKIIVFELQNIFLATVKGIR